MSPTSEPRHWRRPMLAHQLQLLSLAVVSQQAPLPLDRLQVQPDLDSQLHPPMSMQEQPHPLRRQLLPRGQLARHLLLSWQEHDQVLIQHWSRSLTEWFAALHRKSVLRHPLRILQSPTRIFLELTALHLQLKMMHW